MHNLINATWSFRGPMHSRHPYARTMLLAAASIAAALSLSGCGHKLDDATVRAFMDAQIKANDAMDFDAACDAYADDAKYTVTVVSSSQATVMTKTEVCDLVRKGYAESKERGMKSYSQLDIHQVSLSGAKATVLASLSETVQGPSGAGNVNESYIVETIELIKGKPKITSTLQTLNRAPAQ
jgi:hypothetical protein